AARRAHLRGERYDDGYGPDGPGAYGRDPDLDDLDEPGLLEDHYGDGGPYSKQVRWHRPVAWLLALVMGIGMVALAFTAVYRGASSNREGPVPPPASTELEQGGEIRAVRVLLDPDQLDQFDQSFARPTADGRHAPTGWLVRFDPSRAELADRRVRVQGTLQAAETDASTLEVTADHTFVYALRPAGAGDEAAVSLFTVRRELQFRFDRDDLRLHQAQLVVSYVQAGPLSCAEDSTHHLRPLLAGQTAKEGGPAGTDPYATGSATALCGSLATSAQPKV
ncbi:hypothetical protein AB0454_44405, partial [Streptomyces sp. NPDC093509]